MLKKRVSKGLIICLVLWLVAVLFLNSSATGLWAFADETESNFDKTYVLDDLQSSDNFSVRYYPYNLFGNLRIVNFVEYAFKYDRSNSSVFGLYVYIYNPQKLIINIASNDNKIQIATVFDSNGNATDYQKFSLKFCSVSTGNYAGLFYKFRIVDSIGRDGKTIYERQNTNERTYMISGIELSIDTGNIYTDYTDDVKVAYTYTFNGFAAGCGPTASDVSTLNCRKSNISEVLTLDIQHTFYRTDTSSKGDNWQNQIDSVYFSVPNSVLEKFGKLQRIKAEWYEFKTKDIIVTSNKSAYNNILANIGKEVWEDDVYGEFYLLDEPSETLINQFNSAVWSWNLPYSQVDSAISQRLADEVYGEIQRFSRFTDNDDFNEIKTLYYVLPANNLDNSNLKKYSDDKLSMSSKDTRLLDYILKYSAEHKTEDMLPVHNGISKDLFEDDIDDYRKYDGELGHIGFGYSYYDFDADVDMHVLNYEAGNHSFWENVDFYGFWNTLFHKYGDRDEEDFDIKPIIPVKSAELVSGRDITDLDKAYISDNYYVAYGDAEDLYEYVKTAETNDEQTYLFRFALSDYYASVLHMFTTDKSIDAVYPYQAYRAIESVFLDFDVIQLTFVDDSGNYYAIPVVSNPIDIVDSPSAPSDKDSENRPNDIDLLELLKKILAVLLLVVLIVVLFPFLPYLLQGIVYVVTLPFKLIKNLVASIKRMNKKE